jgi:hypothetical protein
MLTESLVGFCLPDSRKACTTACEMVPRTVPSTSGSVQSFMNLPSLTAMENAPSKRFRFDLTDLVEVEVVTSDGLTPYHPSTPSSIPIIVCCSRNCLLTGSSCSKEVSHKLISLGSGNIWKFSGVCSGKWRSKREMSSMSLRCQSLERASAMLFDFPGNH